jgi:hypothetical protein
MSASNIFKSNLSLSSTKKNLVFYLFKIIFSALNLFFCFNAQSQSSDIPIGTWRMHLSYNSISDIAFGKNVVYGAAQSGILVFNREDNSLSSYNTLTGLSANDISDIHYDDSRDQLLVGYADGNFDIIKENNVVNFSRLKNLNTEAGSKRINHIAIHGNFAYLSVDYGIVVFDLNQLEIKETWRNLGAAGVDIKIVESTFQNDSIYVATEKGILVGNLNDNLLDYSKWKRFDTGDLINPVQSITVFNAKIFAAIDGQGLYKFNGVTFDRIFLAGSAFETIHGSENDLLIVADSKVWKLDKNDQLVQLADDLISNPLTASEDAQGIFWIGDNKNGLVSTLSGGFSSYLPNGPSTSKSFHLKYNDEKIYSVSGGFTSVGVATGNEGDLNYFENGFWKTVKTSQHDLTDIDFINTNTYLASFGAGLQIKNNEGSVTIFDETNSPLQNINPSEKEVNIAAIESSDAGLWVVNYGADNPINLLMRDNTWQTFSIPFGNAVFITNVVTDIFGVLWMPVNPSKGGGIIIFNSEDNTSFYRTETVGNGALPNRSVNAIARDLDGNMWVGTNSGVAYFYSSKQDAVKPIFENRFLLKDEKITAIEVDGGNRKWIGTERGVWLFDPSGEKIILNFTEINSLLLSNVILDIEINQESGEVFFATDKGIISYRGDATAADDEFKKIKIFPNPVTANFTGTVGITGLAANAFVKITDISGKLIWQVQASGGSATWNVRDYNGKRAATGIYLVFAASADGTENGVGKIAVVE